jgi:transcriptional regulator with XRE-family HTH domain
MDDEATANLEAVSERVRMLRVSLGLSQDDFADALGVSRGYISNIENKKAEPSISFLFSVEAKYPEKTSLKGLLFGEYAFEGEYNPGAVSRAQNSNLRAMTVALKVADAQEEREGRGLPKHVKAIFVSDLMTRYVEVYQREKLAGADPDAAHASAEAVVQAVGFGGASK